MMASPRDEGLESEIRQILAELNIFVFPLPRSGNREVTSILDERKILNILRYCGAILLINGNVKEEERLWIDERVADIKFDIQRKLKRRLPYAVFDAPPEPRLKPRDDMQVFSCDLPTLKRDLQDWLQKRLTPAPVC